MGLYTNCIDIKCINPYKSHILHQLHMLHIIRLTIEFTTKKCINLTRSETSTDGPHRVCDFLWEPLGAVTGNRNRWELMLHSLAPEATNMMIWIDLDLQKHGIL